MNKFFNVLSPDLNLISPELENSLIASKSYNIDFNTKHPKGVYVVKFRKLKSNNTIFYNYIYYNELFVNSLLFYFLTRYHANNLLQEDIKDCLVLVDSKLCDNHKSIKSIEGIELNHDFVTDPLNVIGFDESLTNLFYYVFKLNYKASIDDMVGLIKYDIELKYFDVIKRILKTLPSVDAYLNMVSEDNIIEFNANVPFNHSFLNNCLILCNDLEEMLSKFNDGGLSINAGSQSKRGEVNSLNYFLSHFDIDYRNSLFYH